MYKNEECVMRKVLVSMLVLCVVALGACSKNQDAASTPEAAESASATLACDSAEVKAAIMAQFKGQVTKVNQLSEADSVALSDAFTKSINIVLADAVASEASATQAKCTATVSFEVLDRTAFADVKINGEPLDAATLAQFDAMLTQLSQVPAQKGGYTVNKAEDQSITVALDGVQ
jgi:hypothetical protein